MTTSDTELVPIYRYTLVLNDGSERHIDATGYGFEGSWIQFDDTIGIVHQARVDIVREIARGDKVGEQEVDAL